MAGIAPSAETRSAAAQPDWRSANLWSYVATVALAVIVMLAVFAALSAEGVLLLATLAVALIVQIADKIDFRGPGRLPADSGIVERADEGGEVPTCFAPADGHAIRPRDSGHGRRGDGGHECRQRNGARRPVDRRSRCSSRYR